jgi:alpha-glucosidase (family GH31 glycosyl hydrolase)
MWGDIDYMDAFNDFTIGTGDEYKDLATTVLKWKTDFGIKYVPIIDAGLGINVGDKDGGIYTEGETNGYFIKSPADEKTLIGTVWPGEAAFPDFTKADVGTWWRSAFTAFKGKLDFDGIWLDMNEVANMVDGQARAEQEVKDSIVLKMNLIPGDRPLNYKSL